MGIKASDYSTLPMCHRCHMERHRVGKNIYNLWNIDFEAIIARNKIQYETQTGRKILDNSKK